jgi:pilus assembly protein CpaE
MARIVLGLEEHDVAEEVMHFLDRTGRARIVATASDDRQLSEAVRQLEPDAVVASTGLVTEPLHGPFLAVETVESVRSLRSAIRFGASGYFVWPREREALAAAAARLSRPAQSATSAPVVAVVGASGGVGATFVATHLAGAVARRSVDCALVDLDVVFAGASAPLGAPVEDTPTAAELVRFGRDLGPEQVRELLWRHPDGFGVLLSPGRAEPDLGPVVYGRAIAALAQTVGLVVLHLPREIAPSTRIGLAAANVVVVVVRLDVASFRDARRVIEATGTQERARIVVNRAARAEVTPADVERVFGRPPLAAIPVDRRIPREQARARLLPRRGRTGRVVDGLARDLLEEVM